MSERWNYARSRLPRWLHDEWEGVADVALLDAIRSHRPERGACFTSHLFLVCRTAVSGVILWASRQARGPRTVNVRSLPEPTVTDPEDGRCDLTLRVWDAAMGVEPDAVLARFVRDEPLTEAQRWKMARLVKRIRSLYLEEL